MRWQVTCEKCGSVIDTEHIEEVGCNYCGAKAEDVDVYLSDDGFDRRLVSNKFSDARKNYRKAV